MTIGIGRFHSDTAAPEKFPARARGLRLTTNY
jgi:hypothetical protein